MSTISRRGPGDTMDGRQDDMGRGREPDGGHLFTEAENEVHRRQIAEMSDAAMAERRRRGTKVHPRILEARAQGAKV